MRTPTRLEEACYALLIGFMVLAFGLGAGVKLILRAIDIEMAARATATVEALQLASSHSSRSKATNVIVASINSEPQAVRPAPKGR